MLLDDRIKHHKDTAQLMKRRPRLYVDILYKYMFGGVIIIAE